MFFRLFLTLILVSFSLVSFPNLVQSETPDEWVQLGRRIHGGFGSYVAMGIRIGLDAMEKLEAKPGELTVIYQDGQFTPCPCVADGLMIATGATPGQNSLKVVPSTVNIKTFGVAIIKNKKTGRSLQYILPLSTRSQLDTWNENLTERERYDAVMNAPADDLFSVKID
ncbi:formylmethanofuran dehydrogenase subunit E family protein [Crocosphaera sp. XPORK-15E]|uniref:formylmethanofuran dehydrogenase subunit E family protein n=1 Tax=Crocosphaera sp. XPORK-15E TaxID=3110247 RepID=UPI002B210D47|nr:formylmethanofuran dehydrogenase subunit E family protein [Crocosphaera sp. XPORK-15E]MEA5533237.1 formylmethanofuran dehydrogenase subunit E family protein [Crocosphaera sp. XPORK-15E]